MVRWDRFVRTATIDLQQKQKWGEYSANPATGAQREDDCRKRFGIWLRLGHLQKVRVEVLGLVRKSARHRIKKNVFPKDQSERISLGENRFKARSLISALFVFSPFPLDFPLCCQNALVFSLSSSATVEEEELRVLAATELLVICFDLVPSRFPPRRASTRAS